MVSRQAWVGAAGVAASAIIVLASTVFSLRAQPPSGNSAGQAKGTQARAKNANDPGPPLGNPARLAEGKASVQDALNRPFDFPFAKPTSLQDAVAFLSKTLNAPVALDRAALDRAGLSADDMVQLELQGVRLKTGLKLLLDQLDLTYRIEPEDNLLIVTDTTGSDEPYHHILTELKSLHRDMHDVQDVLDEVRTAMGLGGEGDGKLRKPTIIEEMPAPVDEKEKGKAHQKKDGDPLKEAPPAVSPKPRTGVSRRPHAATRRERHPFEASVQRASRGLGRTAGSCR